MEGYTIEQLVKYSGYSVGTLYDLTHFGVLSPPVRGLEPKLYGSKGVYPRIVISQIDRYKALKRAGYKKTEIVAIMKAEFLEAADVQVHQR